MRLRHAASVAIALVLAGGLARAQPATVTTLSVTAKGNPLTAIPGLTPLTLIATVTAGGAPVSPGQVVFCKQAPPHCTDIRRAGLAQLTANGTATVTLIPGPGNLTYQAYFLGTHAYAGSQSSVAAITVLPVNRTETTLAATGNVGNYTLTATVTGHGFPTPATGTISFLDTNNANYVLGKVPLAAEPPTPGLSFISASAGATLNGGGVVGDFNGDGKLDYFAYIGPSDLVSLQVSFGNEDGTFSPGPTLAAEAGETALPVVGDFNGDGKLDVAFTGFPEGGQGSMLRVLLGNGNGTFTEVDSPLFSLGTTRGTTLTVGDFDRDGIPDIALCYSGVDPGGASSLNNMEYILKGAGDGSFSMIGEYPTGQAPQNQVAADINGDGNLDLVVANSGENDLTVLLGNGDGTFQAAKSVPATSPYLVSAADLNGDGRIDLIVNPKAGAQMTVLLGNGDGTFSAGLPLPASALNYGYPSPPAVADLNGDGIPDFLELWQETTDTGVVAYLGNGDGTFTSPLVLDNLVLDTEASAYSIDTGDFNGDGLDDFVVGGEIFFSEMQLQVAMATLSNVSIVGVGTHLIEATYPGDVNYPVATSSSVFLRALPLSTSLKLVANPTLASYGQPVTLTGTILYTGDAQGHIATGTVTFEASLVVMAMPPVSNNGATLTLTTFNAGNDPISAAYSGDLNFAACVSSESIVTIDSLTSATTLAASPVAAGAGQTVTLTATVTGPATTPTGSVSFYDGGVLIGTAQLDGAGHAVFSTSSLAAGTHALTAGYGGDRGYSTSTSGAVTVTIGSLASTTALAASPIVASVGQTVTLTTTVTGSAAMRTGSVSFYDGVALIGTAQLDGSGHAVFSTTSLALGTHRLTAVYGGNNAYATSTSAAVTVTIQSAVAAPDFTVTLGNGSGTVGAKQQLVTTVTLASLYQFADTVKLSCGQLPQYVTCVFNPASMALAANGSATAVLNINTQEIRSSARLEGRRPWVLGASLALVIWPVVLVRRRRVGLWMVLVSLGSVALVSLAGCGYEVLAPHAVTPGTYAIPIAATGAASGVTHTVQLTLSVTP